MRLCRLLTSASLLVSAIGSAQTRDGVLQPRDARFQRRKIMYDTVSMPPKSRQTMDHNPLNELRKIDPPCTDCFITYMEAHLEYENKSRADLDTDVNLHHVVLLNMAEDDALCGDAGWKERFFWSGNERTPWDLVGDLGGEIKYGYYLNTTEGLVLVEEFMNEREEAQRVIFGMTWEYTNDTALMSSLKRVHPHWLDVAPSCWNSQVPMKNNTQFDYTGPAYNMTMDGKVVVAYGHAHEGALKATVHHNGADLCDFTFDYTDQGSPRGQDHVKPVTPCVKPGKVQKGDNLTITVKYDTEKYPVRFADNQGMLDSAMGLSLLFVAPGDEDEDEAHAMTGEALVHEISSRISHLGPTILYIIAGLEAIAAIGLAWWARKLHKQRRLARAFARNEVNRDVDEQDEQKSHLLREDASNA